MKESAQRTIECAVGWIECSEDFPCERHKDFWQRYKNQTPQPPEDPKSEVRNES